MQTAFGGGKTHTLLAGYHLFKKPAEVGKLPQIKELVNAAGLKQIPAVSVACLVGTALNVSSSRTFWGEMAYQLGGEERVARQHADGKYTVRERIERLLDPGSFEEVGVLSPEIGARFRDEVLARGGSRPRRRPGLRRLPGRRAGSEHAL